MFGFVQRSDKPSLRLCLPLWLVEALASPEASLADWLQCMRIVSVGSRQHPGHDGVATAAG